MKKWILQIGVLLMMLAVYSFSGFAAGQVPKPKQIVAFLDTTMLTPEKGQAQFCEEYERQTGIKLKIIQPVHNQYYDKLRLAFAAGDFPDVVEISENHYVQYVNEGAFVELSKYIKKSPSLSKMAKSFNVARLKGKLYGIPTEASNGPITYIRRDWLANLGLKAPTTWKEYYQVMQAFTKNDPDQNGKDDTYGATGQGQSSIGRLTFDDNHYRDYFQNASPQFIVRRGKWVDGFMERRMRAALLRLRRVYQEKLIDPEIFTNKSSTCREKFQSGKAGIYPYWAGMWQVKLEENLQKNFGKGATIMPIAPLKGSYYLGRVPVMNAITVKAKNPEGVFKYFIEYSHDGNKGQMLFTHGVENIHWKTVNGKKVALPELNNPKVLVQKAYYAPALVVTPWTDGKDPIAMDPRIMESSRIFRTHCRYDQIQIFPKSREKVEAQLVTAKNDVFHKVLTGMKTVNQALADYRKIYRQLRIDKVLRDINAY
jgi:putative aldouronate transport system substrate-binding protein